MMNTKEAIYYDYDYVSSEKISIDPHGEYSN